MNPILSIQNISYSYHTLSGETTAIDQLSFDITEGEFVAIVGPSGCGKSTLLSLIAGLISPDSGEILWHGSSDHSQVSMGYMLQKDHLLDWRTNYENAALGLKLRHQKQKDYYMMINDLFSTYGLISFEDSKPKELSGGMRQRVALIRTLLLQPDLLLLDEPFSALDYQTRLEVSDDIWSILRKEKKTALLITHDISEAISMADRIIVLSNRPATIRKEFSINLTFETERSPFLARSTKEFQTYFNLIWRELNDDGKNITPPTKKAAEK